MKIFFEDVVGYRDFYPNLYKENNTLTFEDGRIEDEYSGLRGRRLFPLLYRWMATHPYFQEFSGLGIEVDIIQDRQHQDRHNQSRDPQALEFPLEETPAPLLLQRWEGKVPGDEKQDAHHKHV